MIDYSEKIPNNVWTFKAASDPVTPALMGNAELACGRGDLAASVSDGRM